jgi:hypothetical protein
LNIKQKKNLEKYVAVTVNLHLSMPQLSVLPDDLIDPCENIFSWTFDSVFSYWCGSQEELVQYYLNYVCLIRFSSCTFLIQSNSKRY